MVVSAPKFDWSVNLPTMVAVATAVIGAITAWNGISNRLGNAETGIAEARSGLARLEGLSKERQAFFQPKIEALERSNVLQDDRLQNVAVSQQEQRRVNNELLSQVGNIRETLATLLARANEQDRAQDRRQSTGRRER